jgi:hypothetical protein
MLVRRFIGIACALGCAALLGGEIAACSASAETTPTTSSAGGSDVGGNAGGSGVAGEGPGPETSAGGSGGACIGELFEADPVPLDIFVMLDQSGSMLLGAGNGFSRWQTIQQAFTAFVQQPNLDGISMGIQYFGQPESTVPGCSQISCMADPDCTGGCTLCGQFGVCISPFNPDNESCDPLDYAWAEVKIQPLPGVGNAIVTSIGSHMPGTNTPTMPALQGAIDYATMWALDHPDHVTVVAFATDGEPAVCDTDLSHINAVAAAGFNGTPSIKTFVIGVGPALTNLDGIAAAGGTTKAFHVDTNAMATEDFVDALNTIRGAALPCTYQVPEPGPGRVPDFDHVNVIYTPSDGSPAQTLPNVSSETACPSNGLGWYYDDNQNPTQIILCDGACALISEDLEAKVEIELGCITLTE